MKTVRALVVGSLLASALHPLLAQSASLTVPKTVEAGSAVSIGSNGSGQGVLYIVGTGDVLRRNVQLGTTISIDTGTLNNAGHYLAVLVAGASTDTEAFDVLPASHPASVSFLAKPSRLPTGLHDGISGAVYVFDAYQNLVTAPLPVSFELSGTSGPAQSRTVQTRNGSAWTQMDSSTKEGAAKFVAQVGDVSSTRVIQQVPGDPCGLRMTAKQSGHDLELETDPLRDCSGNAVPDGTVVTFTESYDGTQTTVDVPLKRGIAQAKVPAYPGSTISVATGVVMGNEIHWGRQ